MNQQSASLSVEVYSDIVCPWCYIGKRRFERALEHVQAGSTADIIWRPFELNPTMPKDGIERTTYLEAKFGSLETFRQLEEQILLAGEAEHIRFAFEKITRTPNTFLAHRLIWHAAVQGCQDAVVESLFKGYFEEGADIGAPSVLVQLAQQTGLNGAEVGRFLRSDEGVTEVKSDQAMGRQLGIRGVPYFVLNRVYGISGAQPVEHFVSAIQKVQARTSLSTQSSASGG